MRILFLHNNYQEVGGEDIAVQNEIAYLKENYEVKELLFTNDIRNYFSQFLNFLFNTNSKTKKILKKEIKNFKPDVVYVHNTWFMASLGVFKVLKKQNINTIIKVHNFRYDCTKSFSANKHLNGNSTCPACGFSKKFLNFNKYYENSFIKSFLVLRYGNKYFRILRDPFFKIAVLTKFHKEYLRKLDFKNRIFIFPNYLKPQNENKNRLETDYIVYAGRISSEKGIEELIEAFNNSDLLNFRLKIIGEGPLSESLSLSKNIEVIGRLENSEVLDLLSKSKAVISTTKLYEGQPNLLCEASMLGVPSIFPKTGGIEEFFPKNYQFSFKQFDYLDLVAKLNLLKDELLVNKVGFENKQFMEELLSREKLDEKFRDMVES